MILRSSAGGMWHPAVTLFMLLNNCLVRDQESIRGAECEKLTVKKMHRLFRMLKCYLITDESF